MEGLKGITKLQKQATLREYAQAWKDNRIDYCIKIRNANLKWITLKEFLEAGI